MDDMRNLERYASDHYADLLAEAKKTRLIKKTPVYGASRFAHGTGNAEPSTKSILMVLASYVSQILS